MMTTWTPSNCSWLGLLAPEPIVLYEILQLFTKGDQQTTLRAELFRASRQVARRGDNGKLTMIRQL